jgi:hypothetical protein
LRGKRHDRDEKRLRKLGRGNFIAGFAFRAVPALSRIVARAGFESTRDSPAQKTKPGSGSRANSSCAVAVRYFTDAALPN